MTIRLTVVIAALLAINLPGLGPQTPAEITSSTVAETVDPVIEQVLSREKGPGASFVLVQDSKVVYARDYGLAEVAGGRKVSPETIWRIGSISKVFTATAVMQLVDRKLVDLDAPITRYIKRVAIPAGFDEPVTVRQLLDHTAGFDELRPGTQAETEAGVLPLSRFLEGRLVRIRPPGRTTVYSTYGITLAGELVEEVSGLAFEEYLRRNIWSPLGMQRTFITVPKTMQSDVSVGYEVKGGVPVAQPWEWYHTTPASSVNSTAADMAKFLVAHLERGSLGSARLFSRAAAEEMHRQQATMHPSMPGFALGLYEDFYGLQRVLEHGGNMAGFSAMMLLVPDARTGFFVVNQGESSKLRDEVKWAILEKFFPAARQRHPVPPLPPADRAHAEQFAGRYIPLMSCFSCQPIRAGSVMTVTANPDGTVSFAGGKFVAMPGDELRFVNEKGTGYILFRRNAAGAIHELFAGGFWGWQKIPG